ncbi:hypothetical protein BCS42_09215 [Crenothrix sp. D3]|nr:hypothetical protein BCS42_09215 [Crenothrix sp. D3]
MNKKNIFPKISIGMPVYNGDRFIREALDSLLNQTFIDFELIISDNASTDDTGIICFEYAKKDSRIKYIRQDKNLGASANFMFVLNKAVGEYFIWIAHDDYWSNNWLDVLLNDFTAGTIIAFGHIVSIAENGEIIRQHKYQRFSEFKFLRLIQLFLSDENSYKANFFYGLYKRIDLKNFDVSDAFGSDNHLVFKVAQYGRLSTNPNTMLFKRNVATSQARTCPQAYSSKLRQLLLLDYLPYYTEFPRIAEDYWFKVILWVLIPIKYVKSVAVLFTNITIAKFGFFN